MCFFITFIPCELFKLTLGGPSLIVGLQLHSSSWRIQGPSQGRYREKVSLLSPLSSHKAILTCLVVRSPHEEGCKTYDLISVARLKPKDKCCNDNTRSQCCGSLCLTISKSASPVKLLFLYYDEDKKKQHGVSLYCSAELFSSCILKGKDTTLCSVAPCIV